MKSFFTDHQFPQCETLETSGAAASSLIVFLCPGSEERHSMVTSLPYPSLVNDISPKVASDVISHIDVDNFSRNVLAGEI